MSEEHESEVEQLCTFFLDGMLFGIEVGYVQEVIRYQEMTRVPLAPKVVTGLINLRGQIVTALDLRVRLGMPPGAPGALPANIVLRFDDRVLSLLVDEIGDVVEVDEASFEPTPPTLHTLDRDLIGGVYKMPERLLLLLNTRVAARVDAVNENQRSHHA